MSTTSPEIAEVPRGPEEIILSDQGPCLHEKGVTYRIWAMGRKSVTVHIEAASGARRKIELEPVKDSGYFHATDPEGVAGDLYRYAIDGAAPVPDFVSHFQPEGVMGPSMVVDAQAYQWKTDWKRPAYSGQVIYECHIGTFTQEGTYRAAMERLEYLHELGITALEIMPVADFMGKRNWGYDGVMLFAPSAAYGTPDDFRALIDACHARGLAVILDVVFNHLGPEGNFSHQYSDFYFHEGKDNPWGQNFNLDGRHSQPVRALLLQNIRYWLDEFRLDGFRMDATDQVHDSSKPHLLGEVADLVHDRGGFIIAEDHRNVREILEPREKGGWNFNAAWADDFHHIVRVKLTGEQYDYYRMYKGTLDEMAGALQNGWYYRGEMSPITHQPRGQVCDDFSPESFVYCISNHDQVGNRVLGDRFHHDIDQASYRAISLFLCLVPYTPMLFMGQEWGASSPFPFFTDKSEEMGRKVLEGRRREFVARGAVTHVGDLERMPNPQAEETFTHAKLDWTEIEKEDHHGLIELYRSGLKLRREFFGGSNPSRSNYTIEQGEKSVTIHYQLKDRAVSVGFYLKNADKPAVAEGDLILRSNDTSFAGTSQPEDAETIVKLERRT
jgi:maltooligosyltrehalose trehalohydrolase